MSVRSLAFSALVLAVCLTGIAAGQEKTEAHGASSRSRTHAAAKKKPSPKKHTKATAKPHKVARSKARAPRRLSLRAQRVHKAFVASSDLKFMAAQLLENRSPAAYSGVQAYARRHAHDAAGGMAWLVVGYAHILDADYQQAIDALRLAKPQAGELDDYVDYFLGQSYVTIRSNQDAVNLLKDFGSRYPDSLYVRDAAVLEAQAYLAMNKPDEAAAVLEKNRLPANAEIESLLGQAYVDMGQDGKAVAAWRTVYYGMPLSPQADAVDSQLKALTAHSKAAPANWGQRRTRAELLANGRHFDDAAREYRDLLGDTPAQDLPKIQFALGDALYRGGRERDARDILQRVPPSAAEYPDALHDLAEMARDSDHDQFLQLLDRLREAAPTSLALQQTLLSTGNTYLLQKNYPDALRFYQEVYQRAPNGKLASYAHWKTAWLTYRLGQRADAARLFEEQVSEYPAGGEVPDAIYWRARLAEDNGEQVKARNWYVKLIQRYPLYYYADLAKARLRALKLEPATATDPDPLLEKIPAITNPPEYDTSLPSEDPRAEKAQLLENCGMFDLAVKELRYAATTGGSKWAIGEIAHIYQDSERDFRALQYLKRAVPNYYALDFNALPRSFWETLFPRVYWEDVKRYAAANNLDPYLVASLIRQESEFNPAAYSRASAIGLMQLLPKTGRKLARQEHVRHYSTNRLLDPQINIQLGTRYFAQMLQQYSGVPEYALAAYNAGSDRVDDWRNDGQYRDIAEFVESIPFTETREYVQAILRNASVYKRLYAGQ